MSGLDETLLSRFLERALIPGASDSGSIAAVACQRLEGVGWYGAYRLDVILEDASTNAFFLKDFATPRGPKDDLAGRREREWRVYESLLDPIRDGTARYYGAEWEPDAGRFWLLMEWVDGTPLRYEELDRWHRAAAWLARFHSVSREETIGKGPHPWLRRHDTDYFLGTCERAVAAVSLWSATEGARLEAELDPYRHEVSRLVSGPRTLVHGAFLPIQILVASREGRERLCPLDWELAAVGSPAYDLGFLAYGFSDQDRNELLAAYRTEAERVGARVPPDLDECVTLVELHRTLDALSRCVDREYDDESIREYLSLSTRFTERISDESAPPPRSVEGGVAQG